MKPDSSAAAGRLEVERKGLGGDRWSGRSNQRQRCKYLNKGSRFAERRDLLCPVIGCHTSVLSRLIRCFQNPGLVRLVSDRFSPCCML